MPTFLSAVNLSKNELQNPKIHNSSSAPSSPTTGQFYFDTTTGRLWVYDGSNWIPASVLADPRAKTASTTKLTVPGIDLISQSTATVSANQIRYAPFVVYTPIVADQIVCEVTTQGAASTTARLGIYKANLDLQPTDLVLDAGTVAVDSTGVKTISISQALAPGNYLTAFNTDGTPTMRTWRGGSRYSGLHAALGTNSFPQTLRVNETYAAYASSGTDHDSSGNVAVPIEQIILLRVSTP